LAKIRNYGISQKAAIDVNSVASIRVLAGAQASIYGARSQLVKVFNKEIL
jgi:hypothetical protein